MKQTWFNIVWMLSLVVGLTLAGVLAFSAWSRLGELDTARQDQREWLFSQLEVEYLKLMNEVHRAEFGEGDDLEELRKRFDIFYNRVGIAFTVNEAWPSSVLPIVELSALLDTFIPVIDGPDAELRKHIAVMSTALEIQREIIREIALVSISMDAEVSETERKEIIILIESLASVIVVVTGVLVAAIFSLIRRSKSLRVATREAEYNGERLNSMLRASLDAVIVLDEYGKIRELSGSAESIFKFQRDEMLGGMFPDLLVPDRYRARLYTLLERFRETGQTTIADRGQAQWMMCDKNGREFPAEVASTLLRLNEQSLFVTYVRDITEAKAREAEILLVRDEALAAYKEKSRFFAMMSHEMRTPLNGVIAALQLLESGELDEEQKKYLAAAVTSGDILLGHINDVLAIERIEADDGAPLTAIGIDSLTTKTLEAIIPFAERSNVKVHVDKSRLDNRFVMSDPRALQQILVNLLSNAIKFAPGGRVNLIARFDDAKHTMVFEVHDNGIGISEENIPLIFDNFVSLDSSYARRTGGTGLGLGIVKRQVHRLSGTIECQSDLGSGTVFIVELPAVTGRVALTEEGKPLKREPTLPPKSCLVVDDNLINRELLQAMLEHLGHTVVLAASGSEAITLANNSLFDIILMDISMPNMNGMEATQAIKSGTGQSRDAVFIAVTAHALPKQRIEFRDAGLVGFIEKPVRRGTLARVLYAHSMGTVLNVDAPAQQLDDLVDMVQVLDLRELLGAEAFKDRILAFLSETEDMLADLLALKDLHNVRDKAHAMAGLNGIMGASLMHELGCRIQDACDAEASDAVYELVGTLPPAWQNTRRAFHNLVAT